MSPIKVKMDKKTFQEYKSAGIIFDLSQPKYSKNKSAIFHGMGKTTRKNITTPIEILVTNYWIQSIY